MHLIKKWLNVYAFPLLIVTLASIIACTINFFPLSLMPGANLVFGNLLAVAITAQYGLRAGLFVSVSASLPTLYLWGHGLAFIPFLLEVTVVHFALKRKVHPILPAIIYWCTAGALIVYLSYTYFGSYTTQTKIAILMKCVVNGILTTTVGYALHLLLFDRRVLANRQLTPSFQQLMLFVIYFTLVTGLCINTFFWLGNTKHQIFKELDNSLSTTTKLKAKEVENYVSNTLSHLSTVAENLSILDVRADGRHLNNIANKFPGILTMFTTDSLGAVVNTYPSHLISTFAGSSTIVIQREYFRYVRDEGLPFVSDVFQGKGFGNDPILALSVPMNIENKFDGILQASLNLSYFSKWDRKASNERQSLLILDSNNRVLYSSSELNFSVLQDLSDSILLAYIENANSQFYSNVDNGNEGYLVQTTNIEGLGWKTISFLPQDIYQQKVNEIMINGLMLLFCFVALAMIFGYVVSKRISKPIFILTSQLEETARIGKFDKLTMPSDTPVKEINALIRILRKLSAKYNTSLVEVESMVKETQFANYELERINVNLAQIIEDKTQDITKSMLAATQANEAKSAFLANMSHEIRTPLNGIYGTLQVLRSRYCPNQEMSDLFEQALFSARSLKTIVNDVLDFSKIEAGELALELIPFSLDNLVEYATVDMIMPLRNKGVELVIDIAEDCPRTWKGDPYRIRQIILNILSNAAKFTESGEIKLICKRLISSENTPYLQFQIADTGIGMSPKTIKTLFERYTQADSSTTRRYGGTGLGMAITQQLVQLMNGSIYCDSKENKGTTFTVNLFIEALSQDVTIDRKKLLQTSLPDLRDYKLAIIEDNEINTTIMRELLTSTNATMFSARNGKEGVALCKKLKPDIVFMDIHMPVMDGIEATIVLRKHFPDIKIVAVTANVMKIDVEKYKSVGCWDYIAKPVEFSELVRVTRRYIESATGSVNIVTDQN